MKRKDMNVSGMYQTIVCVHIGPLDDGLESIADKAAGASNTVNKMAMEGIVL